MRDSDDMEVLLQTFLQTSRLYLAQELTEDPNAAALGPASPRAKTAIGADRLRGSPLARIRRVRLLLAASVASSYRR